MSAPPPLAWILGLVVLSRLAELAIAARNAARLKAEGWREAGARHYPLFVLLHASLLAAVAVATPLRRPPVWPLVGVLALLQVLRFWTIASLGREWTTRVLARDDAPLTRRGPYRFMRHPAYMIAAVEVAVLPLAFRDWAIALAWTAMNAALLRHRIRVEDAALAVRRALG